MNDIEQLLSRALRHHGAGQLGDAETLYRQVLERAPRHPDALHLHGVIAHQRGQHQCAVDRIAKAVELVPNNGAYLNNLGEAYRGQRQFPQAIACYRRALELEPRDANALNNLALALHATHRFEESERAFREALAFTPGDPEVLTNLGDMFRDRGELEAAEECYRDAIQRAPDYAPAHAWLAVTRYELGDGAGAVAMLTRATRLDPLNPEHHNNLRMLRWNLNQTEHLHDSLREACERLPTVAATHLNLAESLLLSAAYDEALTAAQRALALAPGLAAAHSALGRVHAARGRFDAAAEAHERALALAPDEPLLRERYADALLKARRFSRTLEVLEPAHALAPRRSGILGRMTIAMNELDDPRAGALLDYDCFPFAQTIDVPQGFASLESFNEALHAELERQHLTPNHALDQTMRGGTQTLNNLFQNPTGLVAALRAEIRKVADRFIAGLADDPQHPFLRYKNPDYVFTGAWSTILHGDGYDGSHIHNEGWVSGTYYVRTPDLSEAQHRAREGYIQFGEPPRGNESEKNATRRTIAPRVGLAVLFPSYVWHGVRAFHAGGIRHSVSYNLI